MSAPQFAYAQTRLQARHGHRPDDTAWRRLASTRELGAYLQQARTTVLAPWVEAFRPDMEVHALERELRQQYRAYVIEVSTWLPTEWRPAVRWATRLPDLPALDHLRRGAAPAHWMADDPVLAPLTTDDPGAHARTLRESGAAALADAPRGAALLDAWFEEWRRRWPATQAHDAHALERTAALLLAANERLGRSDAAGSEAETDTVETRLRMVFRREAARPAAAFAHLGLVWIDVMRLRGALTGRALLGAEAAA